MLLNIILLTLVAFAIIILYRQFKKPTFDNLILPICKFNISTPHFEINNQERIARYTVTSKNKNRYFRDFPIGFKFYSTDKFRSKIKITYTVPGDDEIELIYDRIVEFEDNQHEHIYYMNDLIIGKINFEIYTHSYYGNPRILFELIQNSSCHIDKPNKLEIVFPK